jgi:molecular chaperone GrpE
MAEEFSEPTVIRDNRRLDPETGEVRTPTAEAPADATTETPAAAAAGGPSVGGADDGAAQALADERLGDLQRLQAEYVNYRKRVDRDKNVARDAALSSVAEALLPVHLARQHNDLTGPFVAIAEKLEATLGRFGLVRYGEVGEPFDPMVHEALMHSHSEEYEVASVAQILQPGYRFGERVLRPARVAVADPQ